MADVFSKKKRSSIMSRIRSKGSRAENFIISILDDMKIKYQLHDNKIIGKPDIAIRRKKKRYL